MKNHISPPSGDAGFDMAESPGQENLFRGSLCIEKERPHNHLLLFFGGVNSGT
jgi:hypothetical protein